MQDRCVCSFNSKARDRERKRKAETMWSEASWSITIELRRVVIREGPSFWQRWRLEKRLAFVSDDSSSSSAGKGSRLCVHWNRFHRVTSSLLFPAHDETLSSHDGSEVSQFLLIDSRRRETRRSRGRMTNAGRVVRCRFLPPPPSLSLCPSLSRVRF